MLYANNDDKKMTAIFLQSSEIFVDTSCNTEPFCTDTPAKSRISPD